MTTLKFHSCIYLIITKKQIKWHSHTQGEGTTILAINTPVTCAWGMLMWTDSDRRQEIKTVMRVLLAMSSRMDRPDDSQPGARLFVLHKKASHNPGSCCDWYCFTEKSNTAVRCSPVVLLIWILRLTVTQEVSCLDGEVKTADFYLKNIMSFSF